MALTTLINAAFEFGCTVAENAPMAQMTTFRVGGPADVLITIPDADTAAKLISRCCHESIPFFWLGNGSNLVVSDRGIRGAVLRLDPKTATVSANGTTVCCDAGMTLQRLCLFARDNGLTGLEFAYGIPGTVGGAVYMNAGAYGGEMSQVVVSADCIARNGERFTLSAEELALGYRHSKLMDYPENENPIVVGVTLNLQAGEREVIAAKMRELIAKRQEKQPLEFPSAGSFFKRPTGYFAGALVEEAGLKGYRVGDAQVSEKHAGFVINRGNATATELRQLCKDVQTVVEQQSSIHLEPEVRFIGEF